MSDFKLHELQVAVDAWIIQDGNYPDFSVGDTVRCAIEFSDQALRPSSQGQASVTHLQQNVYRVRTQVTYSKPHVWVIDFGLQTFQESRPPEPAGSGAWLEGEIELAIDPFYYMERLCKEAGMPDLFNSWHVSRIERDATPWIESIDAAGGRMLVRDQQNVRWIDVQLTDAWNDDEGRSAYLLHLKRAPT